MYCWEIRMAEQGAHGMQATMRMAQKGWDFPTLLFTLDSQTTYDDS